MSPNEGLELLDVVESLNAVIEADSLDEIELTEKGELKSHRSGEKSYFVRAGANVQTLSAIRETFKSVYKHLHSYYLKMNAQGNQKRAIEGINTIMVLVGEAAQKLERFDALFKEKIPQLDEYKKLQSFYKNKIIKESYKQFSRETEQFNKLDENEAWEREFEQAALVETVEDVHGIHILNDIEIVKADRLYELFYLKNEAGHRFYTEALAKSIKLGCDFGEFSQHYFGDDPLLQIKNWEDKGLHLLAKSILQNTSVLIEKFYKQAMRYREIDIVNTLHFACSALMLAANPKNLIRQFAVKGAYLYFADFLVYLRQTLQHREYQKLQLYSTPSTTPFLTDVVILADALAYQLFIRGVDETESADALAEMIRRGEIDVSSFGHFLRSCDDALRAGLKKHPSGPVFKALDLIREDNQSHVFDTLMLENLPSTQCHLRFGEHEVGVVRVPCPLVQEYIDHSVVSEEFKAFLHASKMKNGEFSLLMMNFQDRTSWKEHARCNAIEELARQAEFAEVLTLITCTKESDFYYQLGPYQHHEEVHSFMKQIEEHFQDESTGYYFPANVKEPLRQFLPALVEKIHEVFFESKKSLNHKMRLQFLELVYQFVTLKCIEIVKPHILSLTSKDALDIGGTSTIGLLALLACMQGKKWSESELDQVAYILYGPTLMQRERAIHQDRFDRLEAMTLLLESKKDFKKAFAPLFKSGILDAQIQL